MVRVNKLLTMIVFCFCAGVFFMFAIGYFRYDTKKLKVVYKDSLQKINSPGTQSEEQKKYLQQLENLKPVAAWKIGNKTLPNCRDRRFKLAKHGTQLERKVWDKVQLMVLFIGYERSGHSLVASILDAHPHAIISDETFALKIWADFPEEKRTRENLWQTLYTNSVQMATWGERSSYRSCKPNLGGHRYEIPKQWQGRFDKFIQIIGDKHGPRTLKWIEYLPSTKNILPSIEAAVKVPIKFIHVVRNPFDIVGRIVYIRGHIRKVENLTGPLHTSEKLQTDWANFHRKATECVENIIKRDGDKVITIYNEDMIKNPEKELKRLCSFLNLSCSRDYLKDSSSIVYERPSKSRHTIHWNEKAKNIIFDLIKNSPTLRRYTFED